MGYFNHQIDHDDSSSLVEADLLMKLNILCGVRWDASDFKWLFLSTYEIGIDSFLFHGIF